MITSLSGLTPSGKAARPLREVCRRSILQVGFGAEAEVEVEAEAGASLCAGPSLLPLHTEVASSLAAVDDLEQRRLLASQILLVGGSAKIPRIIDELEDRLFESIASFLLDSDKVEVVQNSKYADASVMSWTGASIVAGTDGIKGCLVSRDEWEGTALGVHVLRARLPFAWET